MQSKTISVKTELKMGKSRIVTGNFGRYGAGHYVVVYWILITETQAILKKVSKIATGKRNEKDYWSTSIGSPLAEGCGEVGGEAGGGDKIGLSRSSRASTSGRKTFGGWRGGKGSKRWT